MMHITMFFSVMECPDVLEVERFLQLKDNTDERIKKKSNRTDIWTYKKTYTCEGSVYDF